MLLAFGIPAIADGQTNLHERLLDIPVGEDLWFSFTGCPPRLEMPGLLTASDLVVRALVQSASPRISDDDSRIETTYDLRVEDAIFTRATASSVVTPTISNVTMRHIGGTLLVEGRTVHMLDTAIAPLQIGTRLIVFLAKDPQQPGIYRMVDIPFGTFSVVQGKVQPFGVDQQYAGLDVENFAALIRASIPRSH